MYRNLLILILTCIEIAFNNKFASFEQKRYLNMNLFDVLVFPQNLEIKSPETEQTSSHVLLCWVIN